MDGRFEWESWVTKKEVKRSEEASNFRYSGAFAGEGTGEISGRPPVGGNKLLIPHRLDRWQRKKI